MNLIENIEHIIETAIHNDKHNALYGSNDPGKDFGLAIARDEIERFVSRLALLESLIDAPNTSVVERCTFINCPDVFQPGPFGTTYVNLKDCIVMKKKDFKELKLKDLYGDTDITNS